MCTFKTKDINHLVHTRRRSELQAEMIFFFEEPESIKDTDLTPRWKYNLRIDLFWAFK